MSLGRQDHFLQIVLPTTEKDNEGFSVQMDKEVARVRAYREGRHGSKKWASRAAFTTATDLFRFRATPSVEITTKMLIIDAGQRLKMPEEFLLKVSRLGAKTDEILPRVLEAGAEIVEDKVRSNLTAVIGKELKEESRSTG